MSASTQKGGGGLDEAGDDHIALIIRLQAIRHVGNAVAAIDDPAFARNRLT